jgi:hypothetical protein
MPGNQQTPDLLVGHRTTASRDQFSQHTKVADDSLSIDQITAHATRQHTRVATYPVRQFLEPPPT